MVSGKSILMVSAAIVSGLAVKNAFAKPINIMSESGESGAWLSSLLDPVYQVGGAMGAMALSVDGLEALKGREGYSAGAYRDADGWSIGYGHYIQPWENFDSGVTREQAEALLIGDVATAEGAVNLRVSVPLAQNQFDALVSFVYNIGAGAFSGSTLLRLLNAGDYAGAAGQFDKWIYTTRGGVKVVDIGLVRRRASEREQFA